MAATVSWKGGGTSCAVIGCTYSTKKLNELQKLVCYDHRPQLRKDCSCDPPYTFYSPKTPDDRREWLAKLLLKNPPKRLVVCSFHFIDKKPTKENPNPLLNLGHGIEFRIKQRTIRTRHWQTPELSRQVTVNGRKRKQPPSSTRDSESTPSQTKILKNDREYIQGMPRFICVYLSFKYWNEKHASKLVMSWYKNKLQGYLSEWQNNQNENWRFKGWWGIGRPNANYSRRRKIRGAGPMP